MKRSIFVAAIASVSFLFIGAARADDSPLAAGDAAYAQREDPTQAHAALAHYEEAAKAEPQRAEIFWKASRAAWWIGSNAESRADRLDAFQKGMTYGQKAVALAPQSVEAHFWLAGNEGSYGENKGVMKSLSLVKPIRKELAEVIRLDDHYLDGGGYRALGVVDFKVPGIAGGSKKRALEELTKSGAMNPLNPFSHYYLADYYFTVGDKAKAKEELETLRTLNVADEWKPELHYLQRKAQSLK